MLRARIHGPNPKRETAQHPRKPVVARTASALWSLGLVGGIMVVTAALWSAQKPLATPAPVAVQQAQPAQQSAPVATAQAGAGANPPNPAPAPAQPQAPQQQLQAQQQSQQQARVPASQLQARQPQQKPAPAAPSKPVGPLSQEFEQADSLAIGDRVDYWSKFLWKSSSVREKLGPLGDGPSIADSAPLLPKRFDCTTFVETVAALARSRQSSEFFPDLISIRYNGGKTDYLHRNHFPEADWVPNNEKAGIIADVTSEVARKAGVVPFVASKVIDRPHWLAQQARAGHVSRSIASAPSGIWASKVEAKVAYIPLDKVAKALASIPNGAIVNLVRKDDGKHPVLITHQGFLVRENGQLLLRHASAGGNVRTVVLLDYLKKNAHGSWPILGINLDVLRG